MTDEYVVRDAIVRDATAEGTALDALAAYNRILASRRALRDSLEELVPLVHGEYCGSNYDIPECERMRAAIQGAA